MEYDGCAYDEPIGISWMCVCFFFLYRINMDIVHTNEYTV